MMLSMILLTTSSSRTVFFFVINRRLPCSTRTDTPFPYTTVFRSLVERRLGGRRLADLEMPQGAAEEAERMCRSLAIEEARAAVRGQGERKDRKSTRLNSTH